MTLRVITVSRIELRVYNAWLETSAIRPLPSNLLP